MITLNKRLNFLITENQAQKILSEVCVSSFKDTRITERNKHGYRAVVARY